MIIVDSVNSNSKDTAIIDSLKRVIVRDKIQHDSYFANLDKLSDWFILYVSGLFIFLGVIAYTVFKSELEQTKEHYEIKTKQQNKLHEDHKAELKALELTLCETGAYTCVAVANITNGIYLCLFFCHWL